MTNDEKQAYNDMVKRMKQAERFMDDNTKTIEEREKWIPQLQGLMKDMHDISKGSGLTNKEIMEGFIL